MQFYSPSSTNHGNHNRRVPLCMDVSFHWSTADKSVQAPILEAFEPANPSLCHAWLQERKPPALHGSTSRSLCGADFMETLRNPCPSWQLQRHCGLCSVLLIYCITWTCIQTPCAQAASGRASEDLAVDVWDLGLRHYSCCAEETWNKDVLAHAFLIVLAVRLSSKWLVLLLRSPSASCSHQG